MIPRSLAQSSTFGRDVSVLLLLPDELELLLDVEESLSFDESLPSLSLLNVTFFQL